VTEDDDLYGDGQVDMDNIQPKYMTMMQEVANRERDSITVEFDDIQTVRPRKLLSHSSSHPMTQHWSTTLVKTRNDTLKSSVDVWMNSCLPQRSNQPSTTKF